MDKASEPCVSIGPPPLARGAIWSIVKTSGPKPSPRTKNCHVFDAECNRIFIAYGHDRFGNFLNDAWVLDLDEMRWRCVCRSMLSPRYGVSGVLFGRLVVMFGGHGPRGFFADLHTFNLDTSALRQWSSPWHPPPRVSPVMFATRSSIYVWGGSDNRRMGDLYEFGFGTARWRRHPDPDVMPRSDAVFCGAEDAAQFAFAGRLMRFDWQWHTAHDVRASGPSPGASIQCPAIAASTHFLFVFGGRGAGRFTGLRALDLKLWKWIDVVIEPDGVTVASQAGTINNDGAFRVPNAWAETMVFSPKDGALYRIFGSEYSAGCPVQKFDMGETLARMNQREDILGMLPSVNS